MTEGTSLDDLLNAELTEAEEAAPGPVAEPEASGPPRDESGRFTAEKTGVEPVADPEGDAQPEPVPPTGKLPKEDYKAIKEEREKRQALERELEALKNQFQQLSQPEPEPIPSIWEDDQAWQQQFGGHVVSTAVQQSEMRSRVIMSEMLMRQAEPEFDSLRETYLDLEKANPSLIPQVMGDPHPWNKAIQIAKNHRAMQEIGATSIDDLRAKLREELLAEMQGGQTPVPARQELPPTLTGERSVASRSAPAWSGPTPLSDLLR